MSRYIKKTSVPITLVVLLLAAIFIFRGEAQQPKNSSSANNDNGALKPISAAAVAFAESDAVRDLPDGLTDDQIAVFEPREVNELNVERTKFGPASSSKIPSVDATLPGLNGSNASITPNVVVGPGAPGPNFDGLADVDNNALIGGRVAPSDENLAVGPRDIVQTVNDGFRVYDKNGNPRIPPKLISSLFKKLGGTCANTDRGDPIVQHDRMSDRWVISQFNFASQ